MTESCDEEIKKGAILCGLKIDLFVHQVGDVLHLDRRELIELGYER